MKSRKATRLASLVVLMVVVKGVTAVPIAETNSDIEITIKVGGTGGELGKGLTFTRPKAQAGAVSYAVAKGRGKAGEMSAIDPTKTGETRGERNARAALLNSLVDLAEDNPSGILGVEYPLNDQVNRIARASAPTGAAISPPHQSRVLTNRLTTTSELVPAGPLADGFEIGSFDTQQRTIAEATTPKDIEYSRASASNLGVLKELRLTNNFTGAAPGTFAPEIQTEWTIDTLHLRAEGNYAEAFVLHKVFVTELNLVEEGPPQRQRTQIGFSIHLDNDGKTLQETVTPMEAPGSTAIGDWLEANTEKRGNVFGARAGSPNLSVEIPVNPWILGAGNMVDLTIESLNYEFSFEEVPGANGGKGAKAGGNISPTPNLHWDVGLQMLSFDDLDISILNAGVGDGISPPFASDRMANAVISLDPFAFAFEEDGKKFFAGGSLEISDGESIFNANVPVMVLDESLHANEGYSFFAPLVDIQFDFESGSTWIDEYFRSVMLDPNVVPQLFVGLDAPLMNGGPDPFLMDFSRTASVVASGSSIPEPGPMLLVLSGLVGLLSVERVMSRRCQNRRQVPDVHRGSALCKEGPGRICRS